MKPRFKPTDWASLPEAVKKAFIRPLTERGALRIYSKGWYVAHMADYTYAANLRDDWFKAAR